MIEFESFFKLSNRLLRDGFSVEPHGQITAEFSDRLIHGQITPNEPICFVEAMGNTPMDLIGTSGSGRFLVSERIVARFVKEQFTGWSSYPARMNRKNGTILEGYRGLSITGRCGPWKPQSGVLIREKLSGGGDYLRVKGLFFDPALYDRSDFFMFEGRYFICVSKRVRDTLMDMKATNVKLTPLPEVTIPVLEEEVV